MSTQTGTETETQTETATRTNSACAIGAGAAAITCKFAVLGFLGAIATIVGLGSFGQTALMVGLFIIAIPLIWRGFRWAGRRPTFAAVGGLGVMWFGYLLASGLVVNPGNFLGNGMMPAGSIASNPLGLIPVAGAYIVGTALFGWAVYDSYGKAYDVSKNGIGIGIAGASVCGGCGITGLAGAATVLGTGVTTNSMKFVGANIVMAIAAAAIIGIVLYKQAWLQAGVAAVGAYIGVPLPNFFQSFVEFSGPAGDIIGSLLTFIGLGMMFFALVWAYNTQMRILPEKWSPIARIRGTA